MFNLQPGTGVGFTGSKEMALGLGGVELGLIPVPGTTPTIDAPAYPSGTGGGFGRVPSRRRKQIERQIQEEDELMLAVIKAFLDMVNR